MDRILVPLASLLVGLFVFTQSASLPDTVASRFDMAGHPVGFMPRGVYMAIMLVASSGLPLLIWAMVMRMTRHGRLNVPNAAHWLAAPRREATLRFLRLHTDTFSIVLCVFMGWVSWLVAAANRLPTGAADSPVGLPLMVGVGGFMAFVVVWVLVRLLRFRRRR